MAMARLQAIPLRFRAITLVCSSGIALASVHQGLRPAVHPGKPSVPRRFSQCEEGLQCRECGFVNKPGAKTCSSCGRKSVNAAAALSITSKELAESCRFVKETAHVISTASERSSDHISVGSVESNPTALSGTGNDHIKETLPLPVQVDAFHLVGKAAMFGGAASLMTSAWQHMNDEQKSADEKLKAVAMETAEGAVRSGFAVGCGALAMQAAIEQGASSVCAAGCGEVAAATVIGLWQAGKAQYNYNRNQISKEERDVQVASTAGGTSLGVSGALLGKAVCAAPAGASGPFAVPVYIGCVATFATSSNYVGRTAGKWAAASA